MVQPKAIDAAFEAGERVAHEHADQARVISLELEQARYEARLAERRFEGVDPDNRLVAGELEARWNAALACTGELETRLEKTRWALKPSVGVTRETLMSLAANLPAVWNSDAADMKLKQRIVRLLIQEIVADVDEAASEIVFLIHWIGGRHSELRVAKNKTGHHGRCTGEEATDVVRRMAGRWPDEQIAATLNRLRLRTGIGNTWNEVRVQGLRQRLGLPAQAPAELLVNDDFAVLAMDPMQAKLAFQVISERYEYRRSTSITTNRAFKDWPKVFPDALNAEVIAKRLTERCDHFVLDGKGYRPEVS